ncbi:MAG: GTPase Era, partial [Treponema sp.]|nr:GTPase Era [Treponema sp.]
MPEAKKKSAFVTLIGRPSVGKSTLLNKLCGEKAAIVSAVPQTTRNAIRGIVNREQGQLVFVDTPGRHNSPKKFNKKLTEVSARALGDTDLVLYVLDASRAAGPEEEAVAELLFPLMEKTAVAINKTDLKNADRDATCEFVRKRLPAIQENRLFSISAHNGEGVDALLAALYDMAPEGDILYGEEYYTDQEPEFRIAEIIREQAINRLREELPHSLYVDIADCEYRDGADGSLSRLNVRAF